MREPITRFKYVITTFKNKFSEVIIEEGTGPTSEKISCNNHIRGLRAGDSCETINYRKVKNRARLVHRSVNHFPKLFGALFDSLYELIQGYRGIIAGG